ncbi:three-helix bundle dimerization domain-containing protein [Amycolatopsis sp. NPDC059657]|uniref:three-helix bundle dimerization domain-containing protein n=1 Tax=Amycolatopsis sp. NPDC059657 TaxID=3346899 RepID=UPI0036707C54
MTDRPSSLACPARTGAGELHALGIAVERLTALFAARHSPQEISRIVHEVHREFDGAAIRDFVPLLTERRARRRLAGSAPTM